MFLVNDGLFEHFLINKVHENVEIRGIENIQIPFRTHGNVLFRTCYRMYSYVKFKTFSFFLPKILEIHKKGPGGFIGTVNLPGLRLAYIINTTPNTTCTQSGISSIFD